MPRVRDPQTGRWRTLPPMVDPNPTRPGGPGWAMDKDWNLTGSFVVTDTDRTKLLGPDGWIACIAYDMKSVCDPLICNVSRQNGDVCRLPKGHEGLHLPFAGELIACTGIYVTEEYECAPL